MDFFTVHTLTDVINSEQKQQINPFYEWQVGWVNVLIYGIATTRLADTQSA